MDSVQLYQRLPLALQDLACSFAGWRIQRTRYNREFWSMLREYEERANWPVERIVDYRDARMRRFIRHAAETVPYYRNLFRREGLDPRDFTCFDDLVQLPILPKATVKNNLGEFESEAVPRDKRLAFHTSGTTGGGLRFESTLEGSQEQWAVWWRYRRRLGITLGTWCGYFGGRSVVPAGQIDPPFWRYNRPGKQILYSGYHISPKNLPYYLDNLRRWKPSWLHGYPSLLALLAAYVLDSGDELDYQVEHITIGAENLLPQQVQVIERAFGIAPRQHYGMAEAVANISEWPDGKLRVDEDFSVVEFIATDVPDQYRVVGTNFTNPATPLIRYDVGDLAMLPPESQAQDAHGRFVESIDGRREDYVVLPSGARVGRMDHVFKDQTNIREAQIHQCVVGEVTLRVVRGHAYTQQDGNRLLAEMRERIGDDTRINIEYVDGLERSRTGKLRFVISELDEGRLTQGGHS